MRDLEAKINFELIDLNNYVSVRYGSLMNILKLKSGPDGLCLSRATHLTRSKQEKSTIS